MPFVAQTVDGLAVMARREEDGDGITNIVLDVYRDMETVGPMYSLEFADPEALDLVRAVEEARRA